MASSPARSSSPAAAAKSPVKSKQPTGIINAISQYNSTTNPSSSILENKEADLSGVNIKKNSKGGILVTTQEITSAFALLDLEKQGSVNLATLKKRLGVFFPELTAKDLRFLMNNKKDIMVEDLCSLLIDNEITNFDPVGEAFKSFDQKGDGTISMKKLREIFAAYGLGELSDEEADILLKAADVDGDGLIGLEDFRKVIDGKFDNYK